MRTAFWTACILVSITLVAVTAIRSYQVASKSAPTRAAGAMVQSGPRGLPQRGLDGAAKTPQIVSGAQSIPALCSTCHLLPPADVEPRHLWPEKIRQMYEYARLLGPVPPDRMPPMDEVIEYWSSRAPEHLAIPQDAMGAPSSPQKFRRHLISLAALPSPPSVSSVKFVRLTDDGPLELLICDMRHGLVVLWAPSRPGESATVIGRIAHPSHVQVVDLDQDGLRDMLVANLGEYWPVDTNKGSVVWLRNRGQGQFEPVVLLDKLGRVNAVQAADFDGDGDLDLVVGVFGNLLTGMVLYAENFTEDYSQPDFEAISLDGHTGTSDVPVVDLNHDGRPDFVALQSQQHERVVAFLNGRKGRFKSELIYAAPHPRWGSTGIRLLDFDGDGDIDVLLNHGDSVQLPPIPRPYHGFGWLENRGTYPFTYHRLAHLPGAHTLLPADLDGDGDSDLVSSAFIPAFNPDWPHAEKLDTVVWLQQTAPGRYQRYSLETRTPFHPCGDLGDYDGDGDVDIVLGNFFMFSNNVIWKAGLTILENRMPPAGQDTRP
jgi:hypothetical protein